MDAVDIAVVTGTSSGIGLATTLRLARSGYRVFAGMRNPGKADELRGVVKSEGLPVEVIQLDVTSDDSVRDAFSEIANVGPVEVLVNNAGIGGATPLELTPDDEHRLIFETNYFGAVRCIKTLLPPMRERGSGTIVNITSITGRYAVPNQIAYSASKWALECLGEALAGELTRFGVRVVNIEPGVIMTKIFENSEEATRYDKKSPYQPVMRRNGKFYMAGFQRGTSPEAVAETILESVTTDTYKLRWPVGPDAVSFAERRPGISDEDCVALNEDLTDDEYNGRFLEYFGIKL
jgi:NAD(P)-dependent dehydrogenase (short-subunit alcohol dehydrogenase family)